MSASRAVIAAGSGRYADPWHPFGRTSARIAEVLRGDGWEAAVDDDLDGALARLDGVDLLVVNAGDPWRGGVTGHGADAAASSGLRRAVARGIAVLAVHSAVSTLRDDPLWLDTVGGEWVPGTSWHPEISTARVRIVAQHPITEGIADFDTFDERYTDLRVTADADVLAVHDLDGVPHPLVWAREVGAARVAYVALGHDERAFDAVQARRLIAQAAAWAARRR